jgi:hypothetical protein
VPTWETTPRFERDWQSLSAADRRRFRAAVKRFVRDVATGTFSPGLRARRVEGAAGIFEMTWAPNGRATFQFGPSRGKGPHIVWRRIGTHAIIERA